MKKSFKFGNFDKQEIIVKVVLVILVGAILFYAVQFLMSDISKILGAVAGAIGSISRSFSACVDCVNQTDSNGKKIDPKVACPPTGVPFANDDCKGFLETGGICLAAFLAVLLSLGFYKRFGTTPPASAAEVHGNLTKEKIVKITREAINDFNKETEGTQGEDVYKSFKDSIERSQFKTKWDSLHPNDTAPDPDKNPSEFDQWCKENQRSAEVDTMRSAIRTDIDKTYTPTKIEDILKASKAYNRLATAAASGGATPAQVTQIQQATVTEISEQGAALAREAGLDEDVGSEVASRGVDPDRAGEDTRPIWERVAE